MREEILADIISAYDSTDHPNWSFVEKRLPLQHLTTIKQFGEFATVQDTTDVNDDYSRVLWLKEGGGQDELGLRLSLVGPYALAHDADAQVLSEKELIGTSLGRKVLEILKRDAITLLQPSDVTERIMFDGTLRSMYCVLFSSDELVG